MDQSVKLILLFMLAPILCHQLSVADVTQIGKCWDIDPTFDHFYLALLIGQAHESVQPEQQKNEEWSMYQKGRFL